MSSTPRKRQIVALHSHGKRKVDLVREYGGMVAYLHNKYRMIELPQFSGFFGGSRFIPIITSFSAIFIGAFFYLIWPPIQE